MPDPRPKLEVLDGGGDEASRLAAPERRNVLAWVLGLLLVLALAGLANESRRTAELDARVQGLSRQLAASQSALEAHESHLGRVRASVAELDASLAELRALIGRDPTAAE